MTTCRSLSESLLFAEHGENMLCTKIVLNVWYNFCTQHVLPRFKLGILMCWTYNSMNNLLSYLGLVDAKIRASDKDLPVSRSPWAISNVVMGAQIKWMSSYLVARVYISGLLLSYLIKIFSRIDWVTGSIVS